MQVSTLYVSPPPDSDLFSFHTNSLLLDAVDIAAPSQPTLLHYLTQDPIPAHYHLTARGLLPPPMEAVEPEPQPPRSANGTNGHYDNGGRVNASVW